MFWKIYFWFVVVLSVISWASYPFFCFVRIWDWIDIVVVLVALIGLFGYSWKKMMVSQFFWKLFFPLFVAWTAVYQFMIPLPSKVSEGSYDFGLSQTVLAIVTLIPAIPCFIALFKYAFKERVIWSRP